MPYPEFFVAPMRDELTSLGVEELRTPGDVDAAVQSSTGTLMIVVNSVCGCAAGKARPGLALALRSGVKPDRVASVFAGFDNDATTRARELLHRLRAFVAVDRAVPRRQARVHARAQPDREPRRARHRERAQGRVRKVLPAPPRQKLSSARRCTPRSPACPRRSGWRRPASSDRTRRPCGRPAACRTAGGPCSSAIARRCRAPGRAP